MTRTILAMRMNPTIQMIPMFRMIPGMIQRMIQKQTIKYFYGRPVFCWGGRILCM